MTAAAARIREERIVRRLKGDINYLHFTLYVILCLLHDLHALTLRILAMGVGCGIPPLVPLAAAPKMGRWAPKYWVIIDCGGGAGAPIEGFRELFPDEVGDALPDMWPCVGLPWHSIEHV